MFFNQFLGNLHMKQQRIMNLQGSPDLLQNSTIKEEIEFAKVSMKRKVNNFNNGPEEVHNHRMQEVNQVISIEEDGFEEVGDSSNQTTDTLMEEMTPQVQNTIPKEAYASVGNREDLDNFEEFRKSSNGLCASFTQHFKDSKPQKEEQNTTTPPKKVKKSLSKTQNKLVNAIMKSSVDIGSKDNSYSPFKKKESFSNYPSPAEKRKRSNFKSYVETRNLRANVSFQIDEKKPEDISSYIDKRSSSNLGKKYISLRFKHSPKTNKHLLNYDKSKSSRMQNKSCKLAGKLKLK